MAAVRRAAAESFIDACLSCRDLRQPGLHACYRYILFEVEIEQALLLALEVDELAHQVLRFRTNLDLSSTNPCLVGLELLREDGRVLKNADHGLPDERFQFVGASRLSSTPRVTPKAVTPRAFVD